MPRRNHDGPSAAERRRAENAGVAGNSRTRSRYSQQLIEETIAVWQPYYESPLTDADARDIIENMATFAGALLGLRRDLRQRGEMSLKSD